MPEEEGGRQGFRDCYVAYLDILGFKKLIEESTTNEDSLKSAIKAVNHTKNFMISTHQSHTKRNLKTNDSTNYHLQIHAFSDHILFFVPVETRISWFLNSVVMLHDRLLECNKLVRGAITRGLMYYDSGWGEIEPKEDNQKFYNANREDMPVAIGPGLIEAYTLEDKDAVYPRILVSDKLRKQLESDNEKLFPLVNSAKSSNSSLSILDFIRKDFDGLYHLHLLHPDIQHNYNERQTAEILKDRSQTIRNNNIPFPYKQFMNKLREVIIQQLDTKGNRKQENLRKKFVWLANYFNNSCDDKFERIDVEM